MKIRLAVATKVAMLIINMTKVDMGMILLSWSKVVIIMKVVNVVAVLN